MSPKKSPNQKGSGAVAILLTLLIGGAALLGIITYRQVILDQVQAWQYTPTSEVLSIRDSLGLTDEGKLYFDASHTALEPASEFNDSCQQQKETNNPILGCYYMQRIFVFDVTNQRLDGIEQTTAAHEVLHAAYERLSDSDRTTLDKELRGAYERVKNKDLEERMAHYEKTEPGEEANELHSILGTEFKDLGPALEAHYKKYFTDREKVVGFYHQYSSVFVATKTKLDSMSSQINAKTKSVNGRIQSYNRGIAQLNRDVQDFNAKSRRGGGFSSQAAFETARSGLVVRQNNLKTSRSEISREIASINALREKYNALAKEYNALNASINSSLTPTLKLDSVD
ncbi:MAG TPA: hypothetical protein VGE34_01875 [Candidatus Saccharimonadales bacterium]